MFSMNTHQTRLIKLREQMELLDLGGMLFAKDANQRYFEGYTGSDCYLLVTMRENYLFADSRYLEQAAEECATAVIVPHGAPFPELGQGLASLCRDCGIRRMGFEAHVLVYSQYAKFREMLRGVEMVPTDFIGEQVRMKKSPEELERIRRASGIADRALEKMLPRIVPGISELGAARELEYILALEGAEDVSFPTIVAFGARSSLPHAVSQPDVYLKKGDLVLIDYGARYGGYCSDTTRTFVCGESSVEQRERYALVLKAHTHAADKVHAGKLCGEAHRAAISVFEEAGYPEGKGAFRHGLGHGVGLEIHELPVLRRDSVSVLEMGSVVTVEPGFYLEGWGGIRIEDTFEVLKDGARSFMHCPKDRLVELSAGGE